MGPTLDMNALLEDENSHMKEAMIEMTERKNMGYSTLYAVVKAIGLS